MRQLPLALIALLAACAADPVIAPRDCTPGQTATCVCPGASGVQTCGSDGRLGACACPDADVVGVDVAVTDVPAVDAVSPEDRTAPMDAAAVVDAGPADVPLVCDADLRTDPAHCGACGNACPARANAGVDCVAGACGILCRAGFANCNTMSADGCEVDTNTSAAHCGRCGRACATGQVCEFGRCKLPCADGWTRCGASPEDDGSCADLRSNRERCGVCFGDERVCPSESRCIASACVCQGMGLVLCGTGRDRRCAHTLSENTNCGGCGVLCASNQVCRDGVCSPR